MIRHSGKAVALLPLLFHQVLSWLGSVLQYAEKMLGSSVKLFLTLVSLYLQWSAWCVHSSRRQSASRIVSKILSLPRSNLWAPRWRWVQLQVWELCPVPAAQCGAMAELSVLASEVMYLLQTLSHVSPDHELTANEPPQLSETAHNSYNSFYLKMDCCSSETEMFNDMLVIAEESFYLPKW